VQEGQGGAACNVLNSVPAPTIMTPKTNSLMQIFFESLTIVLLIFNRPVHGFDFRIFRPSSAIIGSLGRARKLTGMRHKVPLYRPPVHKGRIRALLGLRVIRFAGATKKIRK
jgi:hypothetical protein